MGWRGPYYVRCRRTNGKPRNEHVGSGVIAQAAGR